MKIIASSLNFLYLSVVEKLSLIDFDLIRMKGIYDVLGNADKLPRVVLASSIGVSVRL